MDSETSKSRSSLVNSSYNFEFANRRDKSVYKLRPSSSIKPAQAGRWIDEARFPHLTESFIEHTGCNLTEPNDEAVDMDYCNGETDEKENPIDEEVVKDDIPSPARSTDFWVLPAPKSPSTGVLAAFSPVPSSKSTKDAKASILKRRKADLEQEGSTDIDQLPSSHKEKQENSKRQRRS
ncbi:Major facilitator superfamily domain general substrate transporter [Penicillium atrosanguineum]|uniref:Major facilitator superfamily domain general substrate transporter n=1 Tax=Penicillium atrosanguineum TaxID=1132637 RepID=UPI0023834C3D|nr:Major facilitator superfamily domain general substrate transporter [Penicillium atrosanguineum]KAJ5313755.1 Major facilitator superfamily domain general substrate transporter [Penicillium atrosanguineum]